MPGGDACNICNNASKYQYIMEELVTKLDDVKEIVEKFDEKQEKRDEILNNKIDENNRIMNEKIDANNKATNEKIDKYVIGGAALIISILLAINGVILAWGLGLLN